MSHQLPEPGPEQQRRQAALLELLRAELSRAGGRIPFDRYMELALYAPGVGYYSAAGPKLGAAGDFVTAPEVSPLFGACLAQSIAPVLAELAAGGTAEVLEFGAGSGALAADLLGRLEDLGRLPAAYRILELSADLRGRQRERVAGMSPEVRGRVDWLERLPAPGWRGVVLANELLDAMPVHRFRIGGGGEVEEQFVVLRDGGPAPLWAPAASPGLAETVAALQVGPPGGVGPLPPGYESEVNLRLAPWLEALGRSLTEGAVLLIDYGYPRREYYLAERSRGTLLCHYRHRAHADPFVLAGLQDITASVDFSAVAEAGRRAGLRVAGFTTQAQFLLAGGLDRLLAESNPAATVDHLRLVQGVKTLTLPGEMGERFKVIALTRGLEGRPAGFELRDLSGRL